MIPPRVRPSRRRGGLIALAGSRRNLTLPTCSGISQVAVTGVSCTKPVSCTVSFAGDTVTILDSGGVGDVISWTVSAKDGSGNAAVKSARWSVASRTPRSPSSDAARTASVSTGGASIGKIACVAEPSSSITAGSTSNVASRGSAARAPMPYWLPDRGARRLPSLRMLKLVIPKGSLERATLALFEAADLAVNRSSTVEYKASIDDPRIDEVRILRPQEIPRYVADGLFDLGITGRDWVEETGAEVVSLGQMQYSKASSRPIRTPRAKSPSRRAW